MGNVGTGTGKVTVLASNNFHGGQPGVVVVSDTNCLQTYSGGLDHPSSSSTCIAKVPTFDLPTMTYHQAI